MQPGHPFSISLVLLAGLVLLCAGIAATLGYLHIPLREVGAVFTAKLLQRPIAPDIEATTISVLTNVRLPRILAAILIGGSLAICGAVFQAVLLNPLADPYTLGISTGAAFGASLVIVLQIFGLALPTAISVPIFAFLGGMATLAVVLYLAAGDSRMSSTTLILAGVIVSAILSAAIGFFKFLADEQVGIIIFWLMGSLAGVSWGQLQMLAPITLAGAVLLCAFGRDLNIMSAGDRTAASLGVSTQRLRLLLVCLCSLLTALAVSVSGIIGFVGLIVPHLLRHLCGPDNRVLLPYCFFAGALLLLAADTLTRAVLPAEVPIGVLTALLGGPFSVSSSKKGRTMAAFSEENKTAQSLHSLHNLWQLQEVSFAYRDKPALGSISCALKAGCCTGILGPNGSGKSTLLDLLAGLLVPQSGEITFQGKPLSQYRRRDLARYLALVPQNFRIRFDFSVREVVEMGLHPHLKRFALPSETDRAQVEEAMAQTGILALAERPVTRLSGGEQQRVALARALAQRPQVLLLDEATASLDIRHSLALLQMLREKVQAGALTVVAVLHDLNLAARFCDQLILLKNGQCHAQGPATQILEPGIIQAVYGVESDIRYNPFTQSQQVSLRLPAAPSGHH